jgi:hypothetical protein
MHMALPTPPVGPIKETHVLMAYDTDAGGFGGPLDMRGPLVGEVTYTQPGGNLALRINLEFGQPNTKYEVFLVCGPAHAAACGFITIGILATNAVGAGAVGVNVPAAVLQAPPFGPGFRNDHLDLLAVGGSFKGGAITAGAINYLVCRRVAGAAAAKVPREMEKAGVGDPMGQKAPKGKATKRKG